MLTSRARALTCEDAAVHFNAHARLPGAAVARNEAKPPRNDGWVEFLHDRRVRVRIAVEHLSTHMHMYYKHVSTRVTSCQQVRAYRFPVAIAEVEPPAVAVATILESVALDKLVTLGRKRG